MLSSYLVLLLQGLECYFPIRYVSVNQLCWKNGTKKKTSIKKSNRFVCKGSKYLVSVSVDAVIVFVSEGTEMKAEIEGELKVCNNGCTHTGLGHVRVRDFCLPQES